MFNKSLGEYEHSVQFKEEGNPIWFQLEKIYELFQIRHRIIHELEDYNGDKRSLREFMRISSSFLHVQSFD